jgi:hypothetical protein
MKVAIVFDSSTGRTKAAAEEMAQIAQAAGHECSVLSVHDGTVLAIVVGAYSLARLLIHPVRMVPDGGPPAWFDPAMYATVLAGVLLWSAAPRLRATLAAIARRLRTA